MGYKLIFDGTDVEVMVNSPHVPRVGDSYFLKARDDATHHRLKEKDQIDTLEDNFYNVRRVIRDLEIHTLEGELEGKLEGYEEVIEVMVTKEDN